ncbi:MAG: hypothetical protein M3N39_06540 [Pseudomonadota bacterium]|nr:hypothetical protein [Pseudomonadota bacterium]
MEGDSGGTALTLVTLLLAQLKTRNMVDLDQLEQALRMLIERPITAEQMTDVGNALAVVQGLKGIPSSS